MFTFLKRFFGSSQENQTPDNDHADTFVEATGGGWSDTPDVIAADGGSQKDYVTSQLKLAHSQAVNLEIGESFTYHMTDIPKSIDSPHEIMFGMMMRAGAYGLQVGMMVNESIEMTRISQPPSS